MLLPVNPPESLYGHEYFEHLRIFRDAALIESHSLGKRRSIGGFVFGTARAKWRAQNGGLARLTDEGIRFNTVPLAPIMPTTLCLYKSIGRVGGEVTTYEMDIDDIRSINIFRNILTEFSIAETAAAQFSRRADERHGLSAPTDEERQLLYAEMQRGASGLYALKPRPEA